MLFEEDGRIIQTKHYTRPARGSVTLPALNFAGGVIKNREVENKCHYNGKELKDDLFANNKTLMWYLYGARYYEPQLGR